MGNLVRVLMLFSWHLCIGESPVGSAMAGEGGARTLWEEYYEWKLETYPEWATQTADVTTYNTLVEDFSIEGIKKKGDKCKEFVQR